ncbi:hypothetical protein MMEU_3612 [Mycobacterium marinum str. Europe]|nr:hypothetical protein MMEU_3612 [Mycobacterium marinum str. Europe]
MASRAARAAETGTIGDGVTASGASDFSFPSGLGRSGAGRVGDAVRAAAGRGAAVLGPRPPDSTGARPEAAREPAPEAADWLVLELAPAEDRPELDPADTPRPPPGIALAAGAAAAPPDESSPCAGPEGPDGWVDGAVDVSVAAAGFT